MSVKLSDVNRDAMIIKDAVWHLMQTAKTLNIATDLEYCLNIVDNAQNTIITKVNEIQNNKQE